MGGALSDTSDSTYEEYVTGNPLVRGRKTDISSSRGCLCGGQFFAPDPHDWEEAYRLGMMKEAVTPKVKFPPPEFAQELAKTMRTAMHLGFFLDHPQRADFSDLEILGDIDAVYYARHGRDFIREANATQNFHLASRAVRNAYRSRLRAMAVPIGKTTGEMVDQAREFNMLAEALRVSIMGRLREECAPFMPPGSKHPVRTTDQEERGN